MPELIKKGHIYKAMGPLYKISYGDKREYAYSDKERDKILSLHSGVVTRFKGLGELAPVDLSETMVNPKTRTLLQYTIEDELLVNETFSRLMGVDTNPRKQLLETGVF